MPSSLHIGNTNFEFEIAQTKQNISLEQSILQSPICLQLQFIPLLYAKPGDWIGVTHLPSKEFIKHLLELRLWKKEELPQFMQLETTQQFYQTECLSWGFSEQVKKWASSHGLSYNMPDIELVKKINSKAFSFQEANHLPEAALLWNEKDLRAWLKDRKGKSVLKTCYGLSGRGNRLIDPCSPFDSISTFCSREWSMQRPILAEPWLDRVFDFSTQWQIEETGAVHFLGSTVFETDANGTYRGTLSGPDSLLFGSYQTFLDEHKHYVRPLIQRLANQNFFGFLGIDALLYLSQQQGICLYPVVEINARKTMSLAALQFQQRWFPEQIVRLNYNKTASDSSLLPCSLKMEEKEKKFAQCLWYTV